MNLRKICIAALNPNLSLYDFSGHSGCSSKNLCPEICVPIPENPGFACLCEDGKEFVNGKCVKNGSYISPFKCNASQFECSKFPKCIPFRYVQ